MDEHGDRPQLSAGEKVTLYRLNTLVSAGYPVKYAERIAASDADLHVAVELLLNGCPALLAAKILL